MFATVLAACRAAGFTPPDLLEVHETSTLVTSVAAGMGVALVPDSVRALHLDGVRYLPLTGAPVTTELVLLRRSEAGSAAVGRVASLVVEEVGGPHGESA